MATSSNRDVTMTLSVETLGQDGIKTLQQSVANLAKEGGDAAPEFQRLADEIGRIGEQAAAVASFKELALQTDALAGKQKEASIKVAELADKLALAEAATRSASAAHKQADAALLSARTAYDQATSGIKLLNVEYDSAGKKTDDYKGKLNALTQAQNTQRDQFAELRSAVKETNAALTEATAEQNKLTTQHTRAETALEKSTKALDVHNGAVRESAQAAERLGTSTENLATSEAALVQALNASRTAALSRAAAMDQVKAADTQAKAAVDSIANAFRTVGVRSAQELETEILQVRQAMDELKNKAGLTGSSLSTAFASGEAKIAALERQLREVNGTLTMGDKAANLFKNSLGQIAAGNIVADGVGYLVNKVKDLGQAFIESIVQGDQLKRGLNAIYKDAGITASQIDFLRKASGEAGVSFSSLSGDFVKFSASMKMANIPMEQSNALFKAVTTASASLGLSAEATAGTLNALGQMASKGTVSMEELRQQLGDRLPGALGLTAQGLGITESQLIALVASGQLATRDFVVPFTTALGQLKGETDGLVPTWERLKGVLTQTAQSAGDSGWTQLLTLGLKGAAAALTTVTLAIAGFSELLMLAGRGVVALYGVLRGDAGAWEFFTTSAAEAGARLQALRDSWAKVIDPAKAAAAATTVHAQAMTDNTAAAAKSIAANTQLDSTQKLTALSAKLAADNTLDASAKLVQYNVAAAEMIKAQAGQTDAYAKLAKAAKEQGDTLVATIKLTGDTNAVQLAGVQAAQLYAAAIDKVAVSSANETALLIAQKEEIEKNAAARGISAAQIKTQIDALDALILKSQAETQQSLQEQAAAREEVLTRQAQVIALKDHSAQIGALKTAMDAAAATYAQYQRLALEGKKTEEELRAARDQLTLATVLYKDSINDTVTSLKSEIPVERELAIAALEGAKARGELNAKQQIALADATALQQATKDNSARIYEYKGAVAEATLEVERLIKAHAGGKASDEQLAAAKNKLTNAVLLYRDAVRDTEAAYHQLGIKTPQELDKIADANEKAWSRVKNDGELSAAAIKTAFTNYANSAIAAAGNIEGEQFAVTKAVLETEAAVAGLTITFDENGRVAVRSNDEAANAFDRTRAAVQGVTDALRDQAAAQVAANKAKNEGWATNTNGDKVTGSYELMPRIAVYKRAIEAGLSEQAATALADKYGLSAEAMANARTSAEASMASAFDERGFYDALNSALWSEKSGANRNQNNQTGGNQNSNQNSNQSGGNKTYTVNLNINGQNTQIEVASESDAQKLISALQRAKGSSN